MTLCMGRRQVLKCLLYVQRTFNNTEPYHILNTLYIADLCVWIQTLSESTLKDLAEQLHCCQVSKDDVQLNLLTLEASYTDDQLDSDDDTSCDTLSADDVSDNEMLTKELPSKEFVADLYVGRRDASCRPRLVSELTDTRNVDSTMDSGQSKDSLCPTNHNVDEESDDENVETVEKKLIDLQI